MSITALEVVVMTTPGATSDYKIQEFSWLLPTPGGAVSDIKASTMTTRISVKSLCLRRQRSESCHIPCGRVEIRNRDVYWATDIEHRDIVMSGVDTDHGPDGLLVLLMGNIKDWNIHGLHVVFGPMCWLFWGQNKMAAILQTTFSNAFTCNNVLVYWFKFHWVL